MWPAYGCRFFGFGPNFIGRGGLNLFPYWYVFMGIKVVIGLVFLFAVIYIAKLFLKNIYLRDTAKKALEILDERYAKGEIEEQEYINKKKKILGY